MVSSRSTSLSVHTGNSPSLIVDSNGSSDGHLRLIVNPCKPIHSKHLESSRINETFANNYFVSLPLQINNNNRFYKNTRKNIQP